MVRVCLKLTCCMFISMVCIWNVSIGTGGTSGFINNMSCLKKENGNVQCITSKFEDNELTANGIRSLVPADTNELHIFCSSYEVNNVGNKFVSFEHLSKLQLLKFWNCKFNENPFLKFWLPMTVRSLELQRNVDPGKDMFSATAVLCDKAYVTSIASTHQFEGRSTENLIDCSETGCCGKLLSLNMSYNSLSIRKMKKNAFHGLDSLEILDLRLNDFDYLGSDTFSKLNSLKTIILTGNYLIMILDLQIFDKNSQLSELIVNNGEHVITHAPDLIKPFQNSVKIALDGFINYKNYDSDTFFYLRNVKSIGIQEIYAGVTYKQFPFYTENILRNMTNLTSLYFRADVTRLHSGVFASLRHLKRLSIRCTNYKPDYLMISSRFAGLNHLETLEFRECSWGEEIMSFANISLFKNTQSLKRIELAYNEIILLPDNFFDDLNQLEFVNLGRNMFKSVPWCLCHRENSQRLRELYLKENSIKALQDHDFQNCSGLTILDMGQTYLVSIGSNSSVPFRYLTKLNSLFLVNNRIQHFDYYMIPKSLEYLDLSGNDISFLNDERNVINSIKLKIFLLEGNKLKYLESISLPPTLTQFVAISSSGMQLENFTFNNFPHLEIFVVKAKVLNLSKAYNKMFSNFRSNNGTYFEITSSISSICPLKTEEIYKINNIDLLEYLQSVQTFSYFIATSARCTFCIYTQDCNKRTDEDFWQLGLNANLMFRTMDCSKKELEKFPSLGFIKDINELFLDGNNITVVEGYYGECHKSLSKIFLNSSHVTIIRINAFSSCKRLHELHLENNDLTYINLNILSIAYLRPITLFLQNNSISRLEESDRNQSKLNIILNLQNNDFLAIPNISSSGNSTTVRNITDKRIDSINSEALFNFSQINLSNNAVKVVGRLQLFPTTPIRYFSLGSNFIESIESEAFAQFSELRILDLSKNNIANLKGLEFSGLGNLENLMLGNNRIETIHELTFRNLTNLNILSLENNRIKEVKTQHFKGLASLKELHLFGNDITNLNANAFHQLNKLTILRLNNCSIKQISGEFKMLNSLKQLYLNENLLTTLKIGLFQNLSELETLHLHTNGLIQVAFSDFVYLNNLKTLTLNDNKLTSPHAWELPASLEYLNLTNNSFTCECQFMVDFRRWLAEMRDTKLKFTSSPLTCTNEINEEIAVLTFDLSLCRITYELLLGSCAGIVFLLFLVVSALYYWRTEVQVWVYSRYGVRLFYNVEEDNSKMFDVFVSFSNDDARFVVQDLVPGLKDYKVCVHYKHFPAGAYIADAIVDAVAQSRRTLLVFSENFMKSPYCKFEFRAAHHKSLEDRCCRLIVLLLEDVDVKDMDPEQKAYFRTNTYLRWDDPAFWKKLYFALPNVQAGEDEAQIVMHERQITDIQTEEQL